MQLNNTSVSSGMALRRIILFTLLLNPLFLIGCPGKFFSMNGDEIIRDIHVHGPPYEIALFTFTHRSTGFAWHSGLMINASHRVFYDPAASWSDRRGFRQTDVRIGFDDAALENYIKHVTTAGRGLIIQRLELPPEQAELLLSEAMNKGPTMAGGCAVSVAAVLRNLPRFADLPSITYPAHLVSFR